MFGAVGNVILLTARHNCYRARQFSSFFGSSSFWSDLRQKAANAITSSLSETERQALLSKYSPNTPPKPNAVATAANQKNDDLVDKETMSKTIAEAVAEARAKEAAKQTEKWKIEMASHQKQMEEAARARVENDLILERRRLQFKQWEMDLEKEKQTDENAKSGHAPTDATVIATSATTSTPQETGAVFEDSHALLGPVVADLGSKRVHLVPSDTLANLPVWKKQRTFRMDRAKVMAKEKAKSLHLGIPGIIGLVQDKDGALSIIDGQHRVGMMQILAEGEAKKNIDLSRILVEVYTDPSNKNADFAHELFVEINKAEPVKLVDMPGVAKETDRRILTDAAEKLVELHPDMFSASQRCRPPHLNIDNLRDALFSAGILKRHDLRTSKALLKWLLEKNDVLATKYQVDAAASASVPSKALEKAVKFQFYLGLESGWMYE